MNLIDGLLQEEADDAADRDHLRTHTPATST